MEVFDIVRCFCQENGNQEMGRAAGNSEKVITMCDRTGPDHVMQLMPQNSKVGDGKPIFIPEEGIGLTLDWYLENSWLE